MSKLKTINKTMKTLVNNRRARLLAIGLALGGGLLTTTNNSALAQETNQTGTNSLSEKVQRWQGKMSDVFKDTWRGLWNDKDAKSLNASSIATASVDLREQQDSYTVRLNLPERNLDEVDISLNRNVLNVMAPADGKAASYRQALALSGVAPGTTPKIERHQKDGLIVINIPKQQSVATSLPRATPPAWPPLDAWDQDVLTQMWRMQQDMDRIFAEAFSDFRNTPEFQGFFDEPRFGSSLDLQERGGDYVIRAYLPDRDMNNVNVAVEGNTLRVEAKAENTEQQSGGKATYTRKAQYAQFLTLPGPVQADKMAVDRKDNMLIVTLPKGTAS